MNEEKIFGLFFLFFSVWLFNFSIKKVNQLKKERYNPFKEKKSVLKPRIYFQSYGNLILSIICFLVSLIFLLYI